MDIEAAGTMLRTHLEWLEEVQPEQITMDALQVAPNVDFFCEYGVWSLRMPW